MKLRVLYIHPFAIFGGATKSLVEMFSALPPGQIEGTVIAPSAAREALTEVGLRILPVRGIAQWDDTRFGHYRGWRWLILLRELGYWPFTLIGILRARRCGTYDVIHCNEVTALLAGVIAKRILRVPLIVHVRSLQRATPVSWVSRWLRRLLREHADAIVAIDEAVRRTLPRDLTVHIVHNGMAAPEAMPPLPAGDRPQVAIIGVLHRSKGVYELLEAVRILRDRGTVLRVLVVGDNVRRLKGLRGWILRKLDFARDVRSELQSYVNDHKLHDEVEFVPFVKDIRSIYARVEAVCFPSHLDAPGRPVFEAALFARPAVVAMREPTRDVLIDGETGICIAQPTPQLIADALDLLVRDRNATRAMGERARRMALARFDSRVCAERMLHVYRGLCRIPRDQVARAEEEVSTRTNAR